ncbi:MAG TPA: radical SAM protein [Chloroflexota bacterium]|nr:radical SAM protein [Chloroflexota bacterium]
MAAGNAPLVPAAVDVPLPLAGAHLDNPRELYIEVTNRCNSLCTTCPLTFDPQEAEHYLNFDEFTALVDQFPQLQRAVLHGIGEPLLNRNLGAMIRYLKARDVHVVFNTNGILLTARRQLDLVESGLDEIRVSCDGASSATYAKLRGVDVLPKVLANVAGLVDTRRRAGAATPRVQLYFTGVRDNIDELPEVIEHAGRLGVDEVHLTRMVFFGEGFAVEDQSIYNANEALRQHVAAVVARCARRSRELGVTFSGAGALPPDEYVAGPQAALHPWQGCRRPWRLGYVTANGNLLPCCIAPFTEVPYDDIILGNIRELGFNAVWNGERYATFRQRHQSAEPPEACRRCGQDWSL